MKLYTQSLCAVAAWNLMCMARYKLLLKRKGWKRGDLTKTRDRWTYRVVVPLNGKALFMPEEFIVKAIRPRRRWHEEEEIAGFPRRRGETLEVWGAKPPEVTEELISPAMGFKGTTSRLLLRRSYTLLWLSNKVVAWGNLLVLLSSAEFLPRNLWFCVWGQ